jgi:tripeptidyl-peptidase-1
MIAPKDESHQLVMQWLESEGLKSLAIPAPRGDSIVVQASISQIEKLLNAEYSSYGMYPAINKDRVLIHR